MKVQCTCGPHFMDDFNDTNKSPCNFWGNMGMTNVDISFRRKVWDWLFAMPADEIAIRYNINLSVGLSGTAITDNDKIENLIPGYQEMSVTEKMEAQRKYFAEKKLTGEKLLKVKRHKAD